jgi:hypothetical protein
MLQPKPAYLLDGEVAGATGVAVLSVAFLCDFFVECFFAGAVVMALPLSFAGALVAGAGVCANEMPATASERERPNTAEVSFFIIFESGSFRGASSDRLCL